MTARLMHLNLFILGYVRDTCKKVSQQPHGVVAKSRRSISRGL